MSEVRALPATWDGRPVKWHGWEAGPPVMICPPRPRECCQFCGSLEAAVSNRGSRRVIEGRDRFMASLYAYRCPTCRTDLVHDMATDETWELEDDDYATATNPTRPHAATTTEEQ